MDLVWIIYFIDVICGDWSGLGVLCVLTFIASSVFYFVYKLSKSEDSPTDDTKQLIKFCENIPLKTFMFVPFILLFLGNFIPSKDTAYKMLSAYGVTEIVQNEKVQELGGKSLEVLEKAMNEYLKEDNKQGKGN